MEKRLLLAFVVSAVIFAVWSILFPPPERPPVRAGEEAREVAGPTPVPPEQLPGRREGGTPEAEPELPAEAVAGEAETRHVLENDQFRVELTTRGAAITSLVLRNYSADEGAPLDLIQTVNDPRRALPLQLVTDEGPEQALYVADCDRRRCELEWADGRGTQVVKVVTVPERGYGVEVEITRRGAAEGWPLSVGTGLRDRGRFEEDNRYSTWGDAVLAADGEVERWTRKKVKEKVVLSPASVSFAGFEDTYFLSVWRPRTALSSVTVDPIELAPTGADAAGTEPVPVLRVLVQPAEERFAGALFGGPKEYDLLQRVGGGLQETLSFGMFHPISVFFLKALRWIYAGVGNWGFAIILLTLAIRILLFPLMHKSTVSMRRMQKLQPKVKAIQEKYKKHKGDAQARAKMNQEMMELYKIEGVNPMGGCLPMLVQLPILWALYTLFMKAIELRGAPFIFWIHDLSTKDPYYVTPILMTATMWLQQRLAPQVGDPQQQRIFRMMPLIFGIMFLQFPSGLVLYWLTNNVITIIQQEVTFHLIGERKQGGGKAR